MGSAISEDRKNCVCSAHQQGEIALEYSNPFYAAMQYPVQGMQGSVQVGEAGARGGMKQGGMPTGGPPSGVGTLDGSVFKVRKVPALWVPESIEASPDLHEAAALRHQARSAFEKTEALMEQANQVIEKIK